MREEAARYGFKLLAVKDEYEVARLWLQDPIWDQIANDYDGPINRHILLHPPTLRRMGWKRKIRFGAWSRPMFRLLYAARRLRGTALDIFGATRHRRLERALFDWYREFLYRAIDRLDAESAPLVVEAAKLPDSIRGYEGVKERTIATAKTRAKQLLDELDEQSLGSRVA